MKYFAYGSNMLDARLRARIPSCRCCGTAVLEKYRLKFNKKGFDGSGKCNIEYTGDPKDFVIGVVYDMTSEEKKVLDGIEGDRYDVHHIDAGLGSGTIEVFVYVAPGKYTLNSLRPYGWYKTYVVEGAREHGLPGDYIAFLESFPSAADENEYRRRKNEIILKGGTADFRENPYPVEKTPP